MTRTFYLQRDTDVTGFSGTGIVADGVEFPDGTAVLRWRGEHASTVVWPSVDTALAVHGHDGATRLVWTDETQVEPMPGEYSQRGFFHWEPVETDYGHKVFVYESSAIVPHMWLRILEGDDIAAHLSVDQARTIRDQISDWLKRAIR
ncbi:hypothetical protein [Nocardia puris]|uniref:Uncharacterized protein n=1 Tax=Nocardia puris TaxID=208602 RepID=A0A366CSG3_9NOCA|nr:hypothetical protein [Nocardia puris]RBO78309.1 hypothetical protein DFR74_1523 [Nocardia puris]